MQNPNEPGFDGIGKSMDDGHVGVALEAHRVGRMANTTCQPVIASVLFKAYYAHLRSQRAD